MKIVAGLLPWIAALAVAGLVTWFVYERNPTFGRWLLAGLLVAHGLIHVLYLVPQPPATPGGPEWPFDLARSWSVSSAGLDPGAARTIATVMIAAVVVGFALAALSGLGLVLPSGWWPWLAGASAAMSLLLLTLFFSPQLLAGAVLDLALLWLVLGAGWRPLPT